MDHRDGHEERERENKKKWYWSDGISGWWFGTFFYFRVVGNNHPNWFSYFSEGLKPPTRYYNPILCWIYIGSTRNMGHFMPLTTWDAPPNGLDQEVWGKNMLVLHLKFLVTLWGCGMTNKFMIAGCLVVFCAKAGFFSKKMSWTWFGYVWFFLFPFNKGYFRLALQASVHTHQTRAMILQFRIFSVAKSSSKYSGIATFHELSII